jgi:alkanesulfonate monooxygenase SsuD/methylene tetrahydromethanopterin reductase-like flavin-dependent oxidoreductase (luciferase family)
MKASYLCMTAYDGPAPGLGVWPAPAKYCDPKIAKASFDRYLDMCVHAEALGFDWVSLSEHHYAPYQMLPNQAVMAAAISQRTSTVRIAMLGPLVPINNPVRLAEEIAMVDVISGGRVTVLFLRGTPNELGAYAAAPEHPREMTQEGIDLILKAWREDDPFAWDGTHYQFANVSVWPKVLQTPNPVVYGSGNSDASVAYAAKRRIGIGLSFVEPDEAKRVVTLYRAEAANAGWQPSAEHVVYRGLAHVARSDGQAFEEVGTHFGALAADQLRYGLPTDAGPPAPPLVLNPYFLGGTETVTARCVALHDAGVGVVDINFIGSPKMQTDALALFAEAVLPDMRRF